AHDANFLNRRVTEQHRFDLDRGDVLPAADDHVLDPVANLDVPVGVHDGAIPGVEPAVAHHFVRCIGVVIVPLHHDVATDDDFAGRGAVVRHLATVAVDDLE